MQLRSLVVVGAALFVLAAGCSRAATQIVVVVSSDLGPAQLRCVRVEVGALDAGAATFAPNGRAVFRLGSGEPPLSFPFSLGVVPPASGARRVELLVTGYSDCALADAGDLSGVIVSRRVRTGFLPDASLTVPVFLSARCLGYPVCDADLDGLEDQDRTCDPESGACVPTPEVEGTPTRPGEEFSSLRDAGPRDADSMDALGLDARSSDAASPDTGPPLVGFGTRPDPGPPGGVAIRAGGGVFASAFQSEEIRAGSVIVGGSARAMIDVGGMTLPAMSFYLAEMTASGNAAWMVHDPSPDLTGPTANDLVLGAALLVGDDLFVCGKMYGSTWTRDGIAVSGRGQGGFLLRMDAASHRFEAVHTFDIPGVSTGIHDCHGMVMLGADLHVALSSNANFEPEWAGISMDGAPLSVVGTTGYQRALLDLRVTDPAGAMSVQATLISDEPAELRSDGTGGAVWLVHSANFDLAGLAAPSFRTGFTAMRVDATNAPVWGSALRGTARAHVAIGGGRAWILEAGTLRELDLATGMRTGSSLTVPPQAATITADPAGNVYVAGRIAPGDEGSLTGLRTVTNQFQPFVASFGADHAFRGVWQWDEVSEPNWTFDRVVWVDGALIVNGSIRAPGMSRVDDESFLWVLPLSR